MKMTNVTEFIVQVHKHLSEKKRTGQSLNEDEEIALLLLNMQPNMAINGFCDIFYQEYSLRECDLVEKGLRKLSKPFRGS